MEPITALPKMLSSQRHNLWRSARRLRTSVRLFWCSQPSPIHHNPRTNYGMVPIRNSQLMPMVVGASACGLFTRRVWPARSARLTRRENLGNSGARRGLSAAFEAGSLMPQPMLHKPAACAPFGCGTTTHNRRRRLVRIECCTTVTGSDELRPSRNPPKKSQYPPRRSWLRYAVWHDWRRLTAPA